MAPAKTFKCRTCSVVIGKTQASIQCRICKCWIHANTSCAGISDKEFKAHSEAKNMAFICSSCDVDLDDNGGTEDPISVLNKKLDTFVQKHQTDQLELNKKFDDFIKRNDEDKLVLQNSFLAAVAEIKAEMGNCLTGMKRDIIDCNKLISSVDKSTKAKITTLEVENNVLHRRLNRGDIVISGMPAGLTDLVAPVISLGEVYDVRITVNDVNHVCYMNNRKQILVKLNNVMTRDKIMREYFKTRSLKLSDLISDSSIGGDLESRIYLNDHYSPYASHLNGLCRKLLRGKIITRFKIINSDKLRVKVTLPDGKDIVYDANECAALLEENNIVLI